MVLEEIDRPVLIVSVLQVVMLLAGVVALWRLGFSAKGRENRRRPSPLTPWLVSGWSFAYGIFIVIAAGIAGQLGAEVWVRSINVSQAVETIIMGAGFQLGLLSGAGVAAATLHQRQIADGIIQPRPVLRPLNVWTAGLLTLLCLFPVITGVNLLWVTALESLEIDTARQDLIYIFAEAKSPLAILGLTSLATVVAPLAEELIFRAGLFRYLRTRTPAWLAYTLPAAFFTILHGNIAAFGPLFVLGVGFAIAYERTGRIAVPIIAHGLFNLNTIVMVLAGMHY
jgi:membrane protease YdiL (CAAX protease family)